MKKHYKYMQIDLKNICSYPEIGGRGDGGSEVLLSHPVSD